mmetsp:Transcript_50031/g.141365  ORF Transcript_50031/g.141365 Transcript_50031/m.141365 type:complete len:181 (+) Transcript_50031:494-1036(+)
MSRHAHKLFDPVEAVVERVAEVGVEAEVEVRIDSRGPVDATDGDGMCVCNGSAAGEEGQAISGCSYSTPLTLGSDPFSDIDVGYDAVPTLADTDGDGVAELVVGNAAGAVQLFVYDDDLHQVRATRHGYARHTLFCVFILLSSTLGVSTWRAESRSTRLRQVGRRHRSSTGTVMANGIFS